MEKKPCYFTFKETTNKSFKEHSGQKCLLFPPRIDEHFKFYFEDGYSVESSSLKAIYYENGRLYLGTRNSWYVFEVIDGEKTNIFDFINEEELSSSFDEADEKCFNARMEGLILKPFADAFNQ